MKHLNRITMMVLSTWTLIAHAACPADSDAALMAARYANLQAVPNPPADMDMADALCGREKYTGFLRQNAGKVVGYKVALTTPAMQKRFNHPQPIRGTMFGTMLEDGAEIPARFGARPLYEADIVVSVKDAGINQAKTPLEALRHIAQIYPFIELPDLMVEEPAKITGAGLAYINMGARLGVLGKPVAVKATPELVKALAEMTVHFVDHEGKVFETSKGSAILEQPLNAVLWLVEDLNKSGIQLKKGDLLSLGSFSQPRLPQPGTGAKVIYEGLPGNPTVSVNFK